MFGVLVRRVRFGLALGCVLVLAVASGCRKPEEPVVVKTATIGDIAERHHQVDRDRLKQVGMLVRERQMLEARLAKTAPDPSDRDALKKFYAQNAEWLALTGQIEAVNQARTAYAGNLAREVVDQKAVALAEIISNQATRLPAKGQK